MKHDVIICRSILENPGSTQRELARSLDVSLGTANSLVRTCISERLIKPSGGAYELLPEGFEFLKRHKVDGALILAAGFGSRFVPLTFETPKGLLEVFGERMIERQIRQLHEAGITDVTIAVGYLKEKFEYLIDKHGVKLLYNPEYASKNTLTTIYCAREALRGRNMYVLASDNWLRHSLYHAYEECAWYSCAYMEGDTSEWCLHYSKKGRISRVSIGGSDQWVMYGPAYFTKEFSDQFLPVLEAYYKLPGTEQLHWENVYKDMLSGEAAKRLPQMREAHEGINMYVNRQPADEVFEFENLEELRRFDMKYQHRSDNEAMALIAKVFQMPESEISEIQCLKAGMTNKSFLFKAKGRRYICRIPGPGTELLINRKEEKAVYDVVTELGITEKIIYFDGKTGYKIAEFYEDAKNADHRNWEQLGRCMEVMRRLHHSGLSVGHSFDLRTRIEFYEGLCQKHGEIPFEDYGVVREWMMELLDQLDCLGHKKTIAHLDDVSDNFLMLGDGSIRLIDWEYAGMCDPLVDVAMCAIYSYFTDEETEKLIHIYLEREPSLEERYSIYAYMALGGFLWSLWAVYKAFLGEEFGEYTMIMYRYAKHCFKKCGEAGLASACGHSQRLEKEETAGLE